MKCKCGILGMLGKVAWLITALAAVCMGLKAAGKFNFFGMDYFVSHPNAKMYVKYVIGIAGAYSLFGIARRLYGCATGDCDAGCCTGK